MSVWQSYTVKTGPFLKSWYMNSVLFIPYTIPDVSVFPQQLTAYKVSPHNYPIFTVPIFLRDFPNRWIGYSLSCPHGISFTASFPKDFLLFTVLISTAHEWPTVTSPNILKHQCPMLTGGQWHLRNSALPLSRLKYQSKRIKMSFLFSRLQHKKKLSGLLI